MKTIAGGSVANTIRGLSAGFGVSCGIIGACGDDEQGHLFVTNMTSHAVNLSRLRMKKGPTAQCVCLVDASANRTMRPCLSSAVKLQPQVPICLFLHLSFSLITFSNNLNYENYFIQEDDLTRADFKGCKVSLFYTC